MTRGQCKVFVLGGMVFVLMAVSWCLNYLGNHGVRVHGASFSDEERMALMNWGNMAGGGGFVMALLCMGAASELMFRKGERRWLMATVVAVVFLAMVFMMMW